MITHEQILLLLSEALDAQKAYLKELIDEFPWLGIIIVGDISKWPGVNEEDNSLPHIYSIVKKGVLNAQDQEFREQITTIEHRFFLRLRQRYGLREIQNMGDIETEETMNENLVRRELIGNGLISDESVPVRVLQIRQVQ